MTEKNGGYFTLFEKLLWLCSVSVITISSVFSPNFHLVTTIASLLGVTALIFIAKGNVVGQYLIIVFSILYAIVSYEQRFFGEMITYAGMSLPSAIAACITWLKNPSTESRNEVRVGRMTAKKWTILCVASLLVTLAFYFILSALHTNKLIVSTVSVTTSFFAAMLLILRSPYYAIAYALNDVVLIVLWTFACLSSLAYLPMVLCFVVFLFNDSYGFYCWRKREKRQNG